MTFLLLVAPPVFMLLFLSGMAVTISEVSQKKKSSYGWTPTEAVAHLVWTSIYCNQANPHNLRTQKVMKAGQPFDQRWDSRFELKFSLSISNSHLTHSEPLRTCLTPCHQTSEGLLTPGLNSAGCLQMDFSKTGGINVPTWFLGGEKGDRMKLHSYPSCPIEM